MRRIILPAALALFGLACGVGAAVALRPAGEAGSDATCAPVEGAEPVLAAAPPQIDYAYVRLNNQFVVPVAVDGRIRSLVVMSLSLEVAKDVTETVYAREPKLRDAFLRVMFDHANSGGFDGEFTSNGAMMHLRDGLREAGKAILGDALNDVLITELARQDS